MSDNTIQTPARGLGLILLLGPSLVWCAEYIGSGEVILATRAGALLGTGILWVVCLGVGLKCWIGLCGARYTVITGEGMIHMFSRAPGPRNWLVWLVFAVQLVCAAASIGALAATAAAFANSLIPFGNYSFLWGWIISAFAVLATWDGEFETLKKIMSALVGVMVAGALFVALTSLPPAQELFDGFFGFQVPPIPDWAAGQLEPGVNAWSEILPLIGWSAGGFASQVWYTYWALGAGYGMAKGRGYGQPADLGQLRRVDAKTARAVKGWLKVVNYDAALAMIIGVIVTSGFLIVGAGVLGPARVLPSGNEVAVAISRIFSERWGIWGAKLFLLSGTAAMVGTQIGILAGWPRLLTDCLRVIFPQTAKPRTWIWQFRGFLLFFLLSNMIIVYTLGYKPVKLIKLAAMADGLLLTSIQALAIVYALKFTLPKLLSPVAYKILKPSSIYYVGLWINVIVFTALCVFFLPKAF